MFTRTFARIVGWEGSVPPDGVVRVPARLGGEPVAEIGDRAFSGLKPGFRDFFGDRRGAFARALGAPYRLELPDGVVRIGAHAFEGEIALQSVRLPSTLRRLGPGAFANCPGLKEIEIPEGVSDIPDACFLGCFSLARVAPPASLRTVSPLAFAACERLRLNLPPSVAVDPDSGVVR